MKDDQKLKGRFAIGFGILLIAATLGLLYLPTFTLQMYAEYYQHQYEKHQFDMAQQLKDQVKETHDLSTHIAFQRAMLEADKKEELIEFYEQLKDESPEEARNYFYLARITQDKSWINALSGDHHSSMEAIAYRADIQFQTGRYLNSVTHASRLPDSWVKFYYLARAESKLSRLDKANQHFEKALSVPECPKWVVTRYAEHLFSNHLSMDTDLFQDWELENFMIHPKAYAFRKALSENEILSVFNQAPEKIICLPSSLNVLAWEALRQDELVTARILLNRSDQIQSSQAVVTALYGILAKKEDRVDYATRLFQTGLGREQYSSEFHKEMAEVLQSWDINESALDHFRVVWGRIPDNPDLIFLEGKQLMSDNQYCEALLQFERIVEINPDYPEIQTWQMKAKSLCEPQ